MPSPDKVGVSPLMRVAAMLLLPMLVAIVVACGDNAGGQTARAPYADVPEGKPAALGQPVPDPKEVVETKAAGQLPDFISKLTGKDLERATIYYKGAMEHYDSYKHIPCYCGCAIYTTKHMNLSECYIKEKMSDGSMVFTDHSVTCSLCQEGAKMTLEGLAQNTPLKDIRANIFTKLNYTQIWTDTPPVP